MNGIAPFVFDENPVLVCGRSVFDVDSEAWRFRCARPVVALRQRIDHKRLSFAPLLIMGRRASITRAALRDRCWSKFGGGVHVIQREPLKQFALIGFGDVRDWSKEDRCTWFEFVDDIRGAQGQNPVFTTPL